MFSKDGISLIETVTILEPLIFSFFCATAIVVKNKRVNRKDIFFVIL
jgi:hypothetical protein